MRWSQQFRFFRDEVIATLIRVADDQPDETSEDQA